MSNTWIRASESVRLGNYDELELRAVSDGFAIADRGGIGRAIRPRPKSMTSSSTGAITNPPCHAIMSVTGG